MKSNWTMADLDVEAFAGCESTQVLEQLSWASWDKPANFCLLSSILSTWAWWRGWPGVNWVLEVEQHLPQLLTTNRFYLTPWQAGACNLCYVNITMWWTKFNNRMLLVNKIHIEIPHWGYTNHLKANFYRTAGYRAFLLITFGKWLVVPAGSLWKVDSHKCHCGKDFCVSENCLTHRCLGNSCPCRLSPPMLVDPEQRTPHREPDNLKARFMESGWK